jgi:hypothetical protein
MSEIRTLRVAIEACLSVPSDSSESDQKISNLFDVIFSVLESDPHRNAQRVVKLSYALRDTEEDTTERYAAMEALTGELERMRKRREG